jgi:hypothetical protein
MKFQTEGRNIKKRTAAENISSRLLMDVARDRQKNRQRADEITNRESQVEEISKKRTAAKNILSRPPTDVRRDRQKNRQRADKISKRGWQPENILSKLPTDISRDRQNRQRGDEIKKRGRWEKIFCSSCRWTSEGTDRKTDRGQMKFQTERRNFKKRMEKQTECR